MAENKSCCSRSLCVPSRLRLERLNGSTADSEHRARAVTGSLEDMVRLDGGPFFMGSESPEAFPRDGEGPVRQVTLSPFYISRYAVTNARFAEFVRATRYRTEAERFGWSYVFQNHLSKKVRYPSVPDTPWWLKVDGANWAHPEGPHSSVQNRLHHPAVHVSWDDAIAFCAWGGYRLPTEAEWEYAARGGLEQKTYPWGDELMPNGEHRCNIWQGRFPYRDWAEDGYDAAAPVDAYLPNGYGLHNCAGNTWEWCGDRFSVDWHLTATPFDPVGPPGPLQARIIRGGSYLCHESYCFRYRAAARTGTEPATSTCHIGFRVARDIA